jgi:hypothetical protein
MNEPTAFWVDDRTDRERAGRFTELLNDHIGDFDGIWGDIAPVAFTCAAWRLAIPPLADPGFVRWHRRVLSVRCSRNTWDGSLNAQLTVASPLPAALSASRTWWHDRGWHEWPEIFGQFVEPAKADLAKNPFIRPVLLVDVPIPLDDLPPTPDRPDREFAGTAQRAVLVVVRELNRLVGPVIAQLDAGGGH